MKIKDRRISWNEETNETSLLTQYEDDSILYEPLTSEEAALWTAKHKF